MIKGMTVLLQVLVEDGEDGFKRPTYTESWVSVPNVLVGEPTTTDIIESQELHGKRVAYTLGIPKGDTHDWTNKKVIFWGQTFQTYGDVTQGIEANIPLKWNKKVKVEHFGKSQS